MTVLPVFTKAMSFAHPKGVPSVFEQTDIRGPTETPQVLKPLKIKFRDREIRVLPAVCAEAIQLNAPSAAYDVAVVVAYNEGIEPFLPTIAQNTQNQIPVVFCNDGRFGGSSINVVTDHRMNGIWWWNAPMQGLLPPGDAILVADVHLDCLAAEFGVTNPSPPASLVRLVPIVAGRGGMRHAAVAEEMTRIADCEDNTVQSNLIEACLQNNTPAPLQELSALQLRRLAQAGTATAEWWDAIGGSCTIRGASDLRDLESSLAAPCAEAADALLTNSRIDDDALLGKLARFKRQCLNAVREDAETQDGAATDLSGTGSTPLDREEETRAIRAFLDSDVEQVLLVTGLDDVGKETAVILALSQAGRSAVAWVELSPDATQGFLVQFLTRHFGLAATGVSSPESITDLTDGELIDRIPLGTTIVINHSENLREYGQWREPSTPHVLASFADALSKRKSKLIIVSTTRIELDEMEPRSVRRVWVKGLPDEHGVTLLDQHLRRAGLDPTNYRMDGRKSLSTGVGNHPGAIILVADYVEQYGFGQVSQDLQTRVGVHTKLVRRILKRLKFTEQEQEVLALLSEARKPIPANVLNKLGGFNAMPVVQSLLRQCVIERRRHDHIILTDLIRGFADFPQLHLTTIILFHKAVAERFASLAEAIKTPDQLSWAIESRYHAHLAGDPNLAPQLPNLADGIVGAVRTLVDKHGYERAKPIVDQLLATDPSAEVYQLAAIIYVRLGDCDEALALAKEAFSKDKARTWIVTEIGRLSLHVHRVDVASECVTLARRSGHDSPYLATLEGKIALRESGEAAAAEPFRRAVNLAEAEHPRRDAWPHFFLGRTLLKLGKTEEAIDVLYAGELIATERRRRRPQLLIAIRTQLAIGYVFIGKLEQAKQILDLIASDDAGNPEVVWALALYRASAGEVGDSQELAQATLKELDPKTAKDRYGRCQVYLFRALIYLGIGQSERASEEFSLAHREDPRNVFVLLRWAKTLIELARESDSEGEHQAARICAEHAKSLADKVLEFDGNNEEALQLLELLSDDFNVL